MFRVVHYGIGALGMQIVSAASRREGIRIVGAIDTDPAIVGKDLGEVIGLSPTGRRFRIDHVTFAHFRDGKIAEAWEIADSAALLQQLQGSPE